MKNLLSIGQVSKLFHTSIKTLRYYDEIDLFKPQFVDQNSKYRYYSTDQFEQLNTINYLKVLGMPLKDIKSHLNKRNIDYMLKLLETQMEVTVNRIEELNIVKSKLEKRTKFLKNLKNIETNMISEKYFEERKTVSLKKDIKNNHDIELSIRELENSTNNKNSIFIGKVGLSIKEERLLTSDYQNYDELFLIIEEEFYKEEHLKIFPRGIYVSMTFKGSHDQAEAHYKKLIDYINLKNYKVAGDSFERTIVDFALTNNPEEYLTEIQIPIKIIDSPVTV